METLTQWEALEALAASSDAASYDHILNTPATWVIDEDGVAHGDAMHANAGTSVQGTLGMLAGIKRHKRCATVTRVAGGQGAAAAASAQALTAGLSGLDGANEQLAQHPAQAALKAEGVIASIKESQADQTPLGRSMLERAQQLKQRALATARSTDTKARLHAQAVRSIMENTPDTPLARLHALVDTSWGNSLVDLVYDADLHRGGLYDQEWQERVASQIDSASPQSLSVLSLIDSDRLADLLQQGLDAQQAVVNLWREAVADAARQVVAWASHTRREHALDSSTSLLVTSPRMRGRFTAEALVTWSDTDDITGMLEKGVHAVPTVIAQAVTRTHGRSTSTVVPDSVLSRLTDADWEALETLAGDAHWTDVDVAELIDVACALGSGTPRRVRVSPTVQADQMGVHR